MFEEAFVRAGSPRRLSFPVALALHGLALGAIVGSSVWFVGEPSEPPVPVTFPQISRGGPAGTPAAPGRSRGPSGKTTAAVPVRLARDVPAASTSFERDVPPGPDEALGDGPGDSFAGDGFAGDGRGEMPGDVGDPGEWTDDGLVRPGGDVRAPQLLRRIDPVYPEAARKARVEGVVILDAVIAASGEVEEVRVIRSAGKLLDDAAAEALRRWIYRPATLNGRSVRVLLTVTVDFRVH
jgi:protein TonB